MAEPASKKRASERQITKDDEGEEDEGPVEAGSFKQAPQEVLSQRKFFRAKRPGAPPVKAASNPFAGISLAATVEQKPVAGVPNPFAEVKLMGSAEEAQQKGPAAKPVPAPATKAQEEAEGAKDDKEAPGVEAAKKDEESGPDSKPVGEDSQNRSGGATTSSQADEEKAGPPKGLLGGFGAFAQQGFSFGDAGKGTGPSTFGPSSTFGGFNFGLGTGPTPTASTSTFPSLSAVFSQGNGAPLQLFSITTASAPGAGAQPAAAPSVTLSEQPMETGEESEKIVYSTEASLFEFGGDGKWKERGKGELRLNVSEQEPGQARLVMRLRGNLRLLLNASLFPDMKVSRMDGRGVTFACVNCTGAGSETKATAFGTFAVRLRDVSSADAFIAAVDAHKGTKERTCEEPKETSGNVEDAQACVGCVAKEVGKESGVVEREPAGEKIKESEEPETNTHGKGGESGTENV